jgi:hypothetical protein
MEHDGSSIHGLVLVNDFALYGIQGGSLGTGNNDTANCQTDQPIASNPEVHRISLKKKVSRASYDPAQKWV